MSTSALHGVPSVSQTRSTRALAPREPRPGTPTKAVWKTFGVHILIPLFLVAGMALAYIGAFHQPSPHQLSLAIVGASPQSEVFAQTLNNKATNKVDVRTVATVASARQLVEERKIVAAYQPTATHATLYLATAASGSAATIAEQIFAPIAYEQHLPLKVVDVVPPIKQDPAGQGLFFLMVALSVGGYSSAIAISVVTAKLRVAWRLGIAAVTAGVISGIAVIVAGPIFQVINGHQWGVWSLAWLYDLAIILIGVGLHPVLRQWTGPALTVLFVMLNITSSGGVFSSTLMPSLFSGLNTFWLGAAWLHAAQTLTYFPGQDFWADGRTLAIWAIVGLGITLITHWLSVRKSVVADESVPVLEEEEAVVAA